MQGEIIKRKGHWILKRSKQWDHEKQSFTGSFVYSIWYNAGKGWQYIVLSTTSERKAKVRWNQIQETLYIPPAPSTRYSHKINKKEHKLGLLNNRNYG